MTSKADIIKIQIARVEKEIRDTPYDKASEHHHGVLKAKLSKLRDQLDGPANRGGGGGVGYAIKHSGDASVVLVGLPSVGKSTLLNALTNAESKVGNYDFTTLGVIPGMLKYKGINIQILDLPGIIEGAASNKGFGKKVLSVVRASNLVVLITDMARLSFFKEVEEELYENGVRINTVPPKISIHKTERGSIQVSNPFGGLGNQTVIDICKEMGISNARVIFHEKITEIDKLIDVIMARTRIYMPAVHVVTKLDLATLDQIKKIPSYAVKMSVVGNEGIGDFKEMLWQKLGLLRVYLKKDRTSPADKDEPLIIKSNATLEDVLKRISNEMREDVSRACIWGTKARFPGQEVSFSYPVFDEMEVWFGR